MQYPKMMQPTHARWEQIKGQASSKKALEESDGTDGKVEADWAVLPEMPTFYAQKFMVTDTCLETPSISTSGYPGPDGNLMDVDPPTLTDIPDDVAISLPIECQESLFKAQSREASWKRRWGREEESALRAEVKVTYNI